MHFNLVLAHLSWKLKDLIACRLSVRPSVHKLFTFLPSSPEPPINLNKITCILGRRGFTYSQTKDNSILIKEIIDREIFKLIWWYSHSFIDGIVSHVSDVTRGPYVINISSTHYLIAQGFSVYNIRILMIYLFLTKKVKRYLNYIHITLQIQWKKTQIIKPTFKKRRYQIISHKNAL